MSAPWVAYVVVGLAVSMIASFGIVLMSLARKTVNVTEPGQNTNKDG
jgi:hypothetical protein